MQQNNISSTAYDDAYRTMLEKCSSLILPVLNEVFGEYYSGTEEVILNQNELFITTPDEMTIEIRTSDGQSISNRIPVMKLNLYGLDELFEKKLWRSIRIQEGRFLMLWVEKSLSVKLTGF